MKRQLERIGRRYGLQFVGLQFYLLCAEIALILRHLRGRRKARLFRGQRDLNLHFGCGNKRKQGWVNIDLTDQADLTLDLRRPLPFESGSCSQVYSEHFFEHLDYPDDAMQHLKECFRVLRKGGTLDLGIPDAEGPLCWYADLRRTVVAGTQATEFKPWPGHPSHVKTPMEQINFLFRQNYHYARHEHRFAYDFETLEKCLSETRFVDIKRRAFDSRLDSQDRADGTLYVTAVK